MSTIAEHNHKEEKDLTTGIDSNDNPIVPSLKSEMLSELMVSFDRRMTNSSYQ